MSTVGEIAFSYPPDAPVAADLENLIARAQAKLENLKIQNYVISNRAAEQRQIDAAVAALETMDRTIDRCERHSRELLESIDSAIDQQLNGPTMGQFGVPHLQNQHQRLAAEFANMRMSLAQHRRSRALQAERLESLHRVQARHS